MVHIDTLKFRKVVRANLLKKIKKSKNFYKNNIDTCVNKVYNRDIRKGNGYETRAIWKNNFISKRPMM